VGGERRPYGTPDELLSLLPTLKRGANDHCAYGAGAGSAAGWLRCGVLGLCFPRSPKARDLGHPFSAGSILTAGRIWVRAFPPIHDKTVNGWGTQSLVAD
jgi:hypothetical protein